LEQHHQFGFQTINSGCWPIRPLHSSPTRTSFTREIFFGAAHRQRNIHIHTSRADNMLQQELTLSSALIFVNTQISAACRMCRHPTHTRKSSSRSTRQKDNGIFALTTSSKWFAIRMSASRSIGRCPLFQRTPHPLHKRDPDRPTEASRSVLQGPQSHRHRRLWRTLKNCNVSSGRQDRQDPQDRSHWNRKFFQSTLWNSIGIHSPDSLHSSRIGPPRATSSSS